MFSLWSDVLFIGVLRVIFISKWEQQELISRKHFIRSGTLELATDNQKQIMYLSLQPPESDSSTDLLEVQRAASTSGFEIFYTRSALERKLRLPSTIIISGNLYIKAFSVAANR